MPATIIRPKDMSALGLIAQRPSQSKSLVHSLSSNAKAVGWALTTGKQKSTSSQKVLRTAAYLRKWAGDEPEGSAPRKISNEHFRPKGPKVKLKRRALKKL